MTHPKHKKAPKGKQANPVTPKKLPIGLRSAKLIRDNRKSAVIVPVVERPWLATLVIGEAIKMPITAKGAGYLVTRVTGACFHETLASIPACSLGHTPAQFDADADWHTVLLKAAWGSNRATSTAEMDARSREGWFVVDFEPIWFPKEWWAQAKQCRAEAADEAMVRPSGDTGHVLQV